MSDARPNTAAILRQLKDFQRDTVEYVFRRMYLDEDSTKRFLVGDEVGLGKTLVARGVIAKTIDHLWSTERRIDVVYVCSNADIARQNINRLNVTGRKDFELASRITLLPISLDKIRHKRLNFVSFTPGTSFEQSSGTGWARERELLYWLLNATWEFSGAKATRVLESYSRTENFRRQVELFPNRHSIHGGIACDFAKKLQGNLQLRQVFDDLCQVVPRAGVGMPGDLRRDCDKFVSDIRRLLAQTCLHWLQPDLVILDEFQRFKRLLSTDTDSGQLAHDLFNYQQNQDDATSAARVLLLSATPYKMYTVSQESGQDDHYADFRRTLEFLLAGEEARSEFNACLVNYREAIFRLPDQGHALLLEAKARLETCLRRVMVRTERLALRGDRNGMLREVAPARLELQPSDVEQYLAVQGIAREVGHEDVLEYWKSAPYLLNFMEEYELKRKFAKRLESGNDEPLLKAMRKASKGLLNRRDVARYRRIDPANARLRSLLHDTTGRGAWKLLWIPAAIPYYLGRGPFAEPDLQQFTKRLVFSCWKVVPKAVAALLSYEAERRMTHLDKKALQNTQQSRKRRRPLLRFSVSKGRLSGMPALMLVYPSVFLATEFDPLHLSAEHIAVGETPTAESLLRVVRLRLEELLAPWRAKARSDGPADDAWYWAAPVILDLAYLPKETAEWIGTADLHERWAAKETRPEERTRRGWRRHVQELARTLDPEEFVQSLGPPPSDLIEVLAKLSLAGPVVCALRSLHRVTSQFAAESSADLRIPAGRLGHAVLHLFNLPDVTAMVRDPKEQNPYWKRVLSYCLAGNFQSMLDEYIHLLAEGEHFAAASPAAIADALSKKVQEALLIRTATAQADTLRIRKDRVTIEKPLRFRTRFAMRFGDHKADDGSESTRADQVRTAFNSPFQPFVLATTSVGQEGLDFHPYCHAVVHWNLPSNPVDLEQREGRVHRYKGHALRKNIGTAFASVVRNSRSDPWAAMFDAARDSRSPEQTDLYPYWISPTGQACIERHVPLLPHSREIQHHQALRKSLVLYRMVFGQNRQEDLVAYLESRLSPDEIERVVAECRIDLAPMAFSRGTV